MEELRKCKIEGLAGSFLFHKWTGSGDNLKAVVEGEDGSVSVLPYQRIRLINNLWVTAGENHKSKSGDYIQVEINVPVDMIHIVEPFITGEPGDYDADHEAISIDECLFKVMNYDENEVNQLAFDRWEKE